MSTPLARGARALGDLLPGISDASGASVRRVEAHWESGLVWTLETPTGARWFRTDGEHAEELRLENDPRLPLAAVLARRFPEPIKVLSWRPGRRVVASVGEGSERAIVKGYRRRRSAGAERTHADAATACEATPFRVARMITRDAELETLVFEHLEGQPVAFGAKGTECFFRIGDGICRLQRALPATRLSRHERTDELRVADRLATLVDRHARLPRGFTSARARLGGAVDRVPRHELTTLHRDLHDGQLMVDGRSIALLDFDLLALGEPELDLANLTAHLTLRSLQGVEGATRDNVEAATEALIEGYHDTGDVGFVARLRLYQAATFLRLSLLYTLRLPWAHLPPTLIDLSNRCLDDLVD